MIQVKSIKTNALVAHLNFGKIGTNFTIKQGPPHYPQDPIILKLADLREGLCLMIERGQITQEQGINIWEDERQRSLVDRNKEQAVLMPNYTL